jgi:hypothetical protein
LLYFFQVRVECSTPIIAVRPHCASSSIKLSRVLEQFTSPDLGAFQ